MGRRNLTSREAARLLGVSEASVKRWADGGLLPSVQTAGGHRRFRPEDVAVFRRTRLGRDGGRAPQGESAGHARPAAALAAAPDEEFDPGAAEAQLFDSLLAGDSEEASSLVVRLHLRGQTIGAIADNALCPSMRKMGELWHAGQLSVAQEHVATRSALAALAALRSSMGLAEPTGLTALCCGVEEDFHELPAQIAAAALEARGWEVVMLGPNMPFYALAEAFVRFRPRLVCVSATVLGNPDRAAREYSEFRAAAVRAGAAVVLGGAGFSPEGLRRRFPAELHADDFVQLERFAATLTGDAAAGGEV